MCMFIVGTSNKLFTQYTVIVLKDPTKDRNQDPRFARACMRACVRAS